MKKLLSLLLFTLPVIWATGQNELVVVDHELTISGTSTLKNWTMQVEEIDITGQAIYDGDELTGFRDVVVTVDVTDIKSDNEAMDQNTYEALKGDAYPQIQFVLSDDVSVFSQTSNLFMAICQGDFNLAGVSKTISFQAQGRWKGGKMVLTGSRKFNMLDFGVEPPTFLMGANKTGDTVDIDLSLTLKVESSGETVGQN
ncbi:MAG: YceI family protein [Saprospiraceae bacterium]|nr:YceI family protein [Saprospiraceae bacterium]